MNYQKLLAGENTLMPPEKLPPDKVLPAFSTGDDGGRKSAFGVR